MLHTSVPVALLAAALLAGCAAGGSPTGLEAGDATPAPPEPSASTGPAPDPVALPSPGAGFDYQLGGAAAPADGVTVLARDSTAEPAPGLYNICYVNGFQTQPGESAAWLVEAPGLVLAVDGEPFVDPGWPDEYLLDASTPEKRAGILARLGPVVAGCAASGFDAVEIDNLDSWLRSDGLLGQDDAVALAQGYAELAHASGLAIAQKNGAGHSAELRRAVGFDFAVTEECARYAECADYLDAYEGRVFDIEYTDIEYADGEGADEDGMDAGEFRALCGGPEVPASMILRDLDLVAPGEPGHLRVGC